MPLGRAMAMGRGWFPKLVWPKHNMVNPRPAGGAFERPPPPPSGFSRTAKKRRRAAPPGFHPPYPPSFPQLL